MAKTMKTNLARRILKLELGAGLIEREESRRARADAEEILRRRAARRASEGLPPEEPLVADCEPGDHPRLSSAETIWRARARMLERRKTSQQSE